MHFTFIPYGARSEVERFFRDVESQKFKLPLKKAGEPDKYIWVTGQVRLLPFGLVDVVFPRENRDVVLATVLKHDPNRMFYNYKPVYKLVQKLFFRAFGLKPIPEDYDKTNIFLWDLEYVSIMPLGLRDDSDLDECKDMGYKGWNHESI